MVDKKIVQCALQTFLNDCPIPAVHIARNDSPPPPLAYIVNFPRITITLAGIHKMEIEAEGSSQMISSHAGEVVFIPANCWNKPHWQAEGTVLNVLFGKKQIGLSMVEQTVDSESPERVIKLAIPGPLDSASYKILEALNEFRHHSNADAVYRLLIKALLHCCLQAIEMAPAYTASKSKTTFESICTYVQENFHKQISRDHVADAFKLSPNHVSRLFQKEGSMTYSEYLTFVRIDRAKFMLRHYSMTLDEISTSCGYHDTSYFCRIFRKITKRTPSAYRYASQ